jgi:CheY-like chemotaxis protein
MPKNSGFKLMNTIRLYNEELTVLHVEDDPLLAHLVKASFQRFGFTGDIITTASVRDAVRQLRDRSTNGKPVNLIISDMQLPDGTGLDLIREVKTDPAWRMTPVIVLSNRAGDGIVNDAYALGASSYIPKESLWSAADGSLHDIYRFWLECAKLPAQIRGDRLQEALERAISLRTRSAELYLRLARAFGREPEESAFWLHRALDEGNLSNLLAFFRNRVHEERASKDIIDRLDSMQAAVKDRLKSAEEQLTAARVPSRDLACQLALELVEALDEEVFAALLGILFPVSSVATPALKARASSQIKDLASHVRERTTDAELRRRADALLALSQRLAAGNERES